MTTSYVAAQPAINTLRTQSQEPAGDHPDPAANGSRDSAVSLADVIATLVYIGTSDGGEPNDSGVDYDSLKDGDWFDGTGQVMYPDGLVDAWDKVGRRYDRSPSPPPDPPWEVGPPNGAINLGDMIPLLAQVGLGCSASP